MILLAYVMPSGLYAPASLLARVQLAPDLGDLALDLDTLTPDRSTLVGMGIGDLLLNDAVVEGNRIGTLIMRRIGFASTADFDSFAPTDAAKIAALSDLFTAAIGARFGVFVTADPVDLAAAPPETS